jgi:hypothetical protein
LSGRWVFVRAFLVPNNIVSLVANVPIVLNWRGLCVPSHLTLDVRSRIRRLQACFLPRTLFPPSPLDASWIEDVIRRKTLDVLGKKNSTRTWDYRAITSLCQHCLNTFLLCLLRLGRPPSLIFMVPQESQEIIMVFQHPPEV